MSPVLIIVINFVAGTLCLMYGVNLMSSSLEKANLKAIKKLLSACMGNVFKSFFSGTLITALVQSSTAITVITVGLVDSGLLQLSQAVGIIYGANLGTTITAQIMSFKGGYFPVPLLAAGILIRLLSRRPSLRYFSQSIIGLGLMLLGIGILNSGAPYIKESQIVYNLFSQYGTYPLFGLVLGMAATMLVHSSSATVGLTIALFNSGLISFEAAVGLTLGDNIGTCITAQLASLGTGIAARRTAWAHTLYNIIGVLIIFVFFIPFTSFVRYATSSIGQDSTRLIANTHTIFNVLSALLFLPVTKYYVKFIEWIIPSKNNRMYNL